MVAFGHLPNDAAGTGPGDKHGRKIVVGCSERVPFPLCCPLFSLSLSFQLKLTHLPLFLSPNFMYKKNARRETQNDSVSNENAVPLPRTRAHARRRDGFTVQTKVSIFIGVNLRGNV